MLKGLHFFSGTLKMLLQLLSHLQFSPTRNRLLCLSCFSVHVACFLPLWLLIRFLSLVLLNLVFMFLVLGVGWLCRFIYSSNLEHLGLVSSVFFFFCIHPLLSSSSIPITRILGHIKVSHSSLMLYFS